MQQETIGPLWAVIVHLRFGTDKARKANQSEDYRLSASNTSRPRMPGLEASGSKLGQLSAFSRVLGLED